VTVLRAESLINDGTALVLYGLAVGVTVGEEHLTVWHVSGLLVLAYVGGALAGALIGLVSWQVRRRIDDPMLEAIAMLVTPFAAFLLADVVHGSGVLAVVVCGLFMSQVTPRITGAVTRQIAMPFWALSTTVLSSALFVLVGVSAQSAVRGLSSASMLRALVDVLVVTAVVIGVRWAWVYTTPTSSGSSIAARPSGCAVFRRGSAWSAQGRGFGGRCHSPQSSPYRRPWTPVPHSPDGT
jgi:CPA1 family monovalent cation:H+ antiporter